MSAHRKGHEPIRLHLFKLGPPCCGKGYTGDMIKKMYPDLYQVRLGDIIRSMMSDNSTLTPEQRKVVNEHGGLLPDDMINHILIDRNHTGVERGCTKFEYDGPCRTVGQTEFLMHSGIIEPHNSKFVVFKATLETCMRNATGANSKHRGGRLDDSKIRERYRLAMKNLPLIVASLRREGYKVVEIDANGTLKNTWDNYRTYAKQLFERQQVTSERRVNHHNSPVLQVALA